MVHPGAVYMHLGENYVVTPREMVPDTEYFWLLKKMLSGLILASQLFFGYLDGILTVRMGFESYPALPSLYKHEGTGIKLGTHIDDSLSAGKDLMALKNMYAESRQMFDFYLKKEDV